MSKIITVTDSNFIDEVINSDIPVLVDFYADWCKPCKELSPIIDEIADEVNGAKVCKANIEQNQYAVNRFRIMSVPTVMIFNDGELVTKLLDKHTKEEYLSILREVN